MAHVILVFKLQSSLVISFSAQAVTPSIIMIDLPVVVTEDLSSTSVHDPSMKFLLKPVSIPVTQDSTCK